MKKAKIIILCCLWIFFLFSCASSVKIKVQRPAEYDLQGARSISVLPFTTTGLFWGPEKEKIANYISSSIQSNLIQSGYFSVIDSSFVNSALRKKTSLPCDVYIKGAILDFSDIINASSLEDEEEEQIEYARHVKFLVSYAIVNGKTHEIIATNQERFSFTSLREKFIYNLPSALYLAQWDLDLFVSDLLKKIEPYTETRKVFMLKDKSKNEIMMQGSEFVKEGNLSAALEKYLSVYNELGLFEAGYNAARIMEAQGKYTEAEKLMLEVYNKTGEKKARNAIKEIQREIKDDQIFKEQQEKRNSQEKNVYEK